MTGPRLWPMLSAVIVFLAGTAAIEVVARNAEGHRQTWEISGNEVAADGEQDSDDEADEGWQSVEPVNPAHAEARLLARRGEHEQSLARFAAAIAALPDNAALVAEYGHWLRRAGRRDEAEQALARALALDPSNAPAHLDRALLARDRGDRRVSAASFAEALRLRPMHTATRIAYARDLREQQRVDEAIAMLEPVTVTGSNDRRAHALAALGQAHAAVGHAAEARAAFEKAIERAPAVASLWARAALELGQLGDADSTAEALRYARQALRLAPDSAWVADVAGRVYERADLATEAYAAYQQASKLDGGLRHPRQRLVRMALDREDFTAARRGAMALLEQGPQRPEASFLVGLVEFKAGRLAEARDSFQKAIAAAKDPYAEAWYNLGLLERAAERPAEAIAAYQQAIAARPKYLAAINNLGLVYADQERHAEAEAQYSVALALKPTYTAAWVNLARTHAARGRVDEAIADYRRALEIDPDERSARLQLAVTLRKQGRVDEAIAEYQALLARHPRHVKAWFNLGIALAAEDRGDEAVAAYEQALTHDREHFGARKNLGLLLLRRELVDAASEHLTEALEARPDDAEIRLALAEIARRSGDASTCTTHADAVLRQAPDDPAARVLLDKCATTP